MIIEPRKSADEIDRRLSALDDPEFAEVIRAANRDIFHIPEPPAPYWKTRIGLMTLAGLFALAAGYSSYANAPRPIPGIAPHRVARAHPVPTPVKHRSAPVTPHAAPARHAVAAAVAPSEATIRKIRAQLAQERAVAAQARSEALYAQHQAQVAMQERAEARAKAHAQAVAQAHAQAVAQAQVQAQARAEALAQARAEALAQARAQAQAKAQAELVPQSNEDRPAPSSGMSIKPGQAPPPSSPVISTYPVPNAIPPMPGPMDKNCTPSRGGIFIHALNNVGVGGTSVGGLLRLIH
jgi:DNA polymerase III gamma/tau subunit